MPDDEHGTPPKRTKARDDRRVVGVAAIAVDLDEPFHQVSHVVEREGAARMAGDERFLPGGEGGEHLFPRCVELDLELFALALRRDVVAHAGQRLDATLELQDRFFESVLVHPSEIVDREDVCQARG